MEEKKLASSMSGDDYAHEPVPVEGRKSWVDMTFVWFGAAMVSQLYNGGVALGTGMGNLENALWAIFWGASFLALFAALNGYVGAVTHCNAALTGRFAYGSIGVAIPGFHIADIGWFIVIASIFANIMGYVIPSVDTRVWAILTCMLFITNNYIGFNSMIILNKIAFPLLFLIGMYGIYRVQIVTPGGIPAVFDMVYPEKYSLSAGIVLVIGTWAAGCSRAADYMRFARRRVDSFLATFIGFFAGFCLCIVCGAIYGAATGESSIGPTLSTLGFVGLGAFMFFVQSWTTDEHCSYVTSTALPTTIEVVTKKRVPRRFIVLGVGLLGVCICGLDIQAYYVPFISFLGYIIPSIGAISIADYFIMSKTKYHWTGHKNYYDYNVNSPDVMHHKFNWVVIPSLVIGMLLGWKLTWGIPSITAFVGTIVVYVLFSLLSYAMGLQKKEVALNESLSKNG